ncbi:MAG TPA: phage terminase large subunit family protein [Rubrivivax sp.]|nr:phage terminase large subunit family protein [Rubrivivax sp.]
MTAITPAHQLVLAACERAVRPRKRMTVSEWADAHRMLALEGSAEPGPWRTSRTPYLREIMDQLSEHSRARKVVFRKSSQVGGTEASSNWLGYIIAYAKGPVAVVMPSEKSLTDWMAQKFEPMAGATAAVRDVLAVRSNRAADNNASRKKFIGGILFAKTAGSTADLKSTSLRYAIADEVDEYDWTTLQGDPLGLLEVRLTTFHDRKLFVVSSPTIKDASRIDEEHDGGDQRLYCVPCPHCDERQPLQWSGLRWTAPLPPRRHVEVAWYVCRGCGAEIAEHHKPRMLDHGAWVPQAPGNPYPSYHISALYSPPGLGLSWPELASEWIEAQSDPAKLMRFVNTRLGESWANRTGDIKPNALAARAEPVALRQIPPGCLILTAGVDVQDDRLEAHILGWGWRDRQICCWVIDYHVLPGRPSEAPVWDDLAAYLNTPLANGWGRSMVPAATAIDTGHHTHAVYAFVRAGRVPRPMAVKGASTPGRNILGRPTMQDVNWAGKVERKGVALYSIGTEAGKFQLYSWLEADAARDADQRHVRFPSGLESAYYEQLVSEVHNPRKNRWELRKGRRNEALDTWVYAYAATHHPALFMHRWRPVDWRRLADLIEPGADGAADGSQDAADPAAAGDAADAAATAAAADAAAASDATPGAPDDPVADPAQPPAPDALPGAEKPPSGAPGAAAAAAAAPVVRPESPQSAALALHRRRVLSRGLH